MAPMIVLTRSREENERIAPDVHRYGFATVSVPMIEFDTLSVDAAGFRAENKLTGEEPILLTSSRAAEGWLLLRAGAFADRHPSGYILVGHRSAAMVRDADPGVRILAVAESAEDLLSSDNADLFRGITTIVYPCSSRRRNELVDGLRARAIRLCDIPLYTPVIPADAGLQLHRVIDQGGDQLAFFFFSPSAVDHFFEALSLPLRSVPLRKAIFCAIGTTTAEALRRNGITDIITPSHPNLAALLDIVAASIR